MPVKKKRTKKTHVKNINDTPATVKYGKSEKYPKGGFAKVYSDIIWRGD